MTDILKDGDVVTIAGVFKIRTFRQWLTRKPRQLAEFRIGNASALYPLRPSSLEAREPTLTVESIPSDRDPC